MSLRTITISLCFLTACVSKTGEKTKSFLRADSVKIVSMINEREKAMISRDINAITKQFDSSASFINGGGFLYEGISEIRNFHSIMFNNDSLTYTYQIGKIWIKPVGEGITMIYYPWRQQWTLKNIKSDTLNEVGLMSITAVKQNSEWKWKAITNQRTKEYFEDLREHKASAIQ